jgi:hypothetical protein
VPVCVVADTIVRTVELGVMITNAALDRDTTVVFCKLITAGPVAAQAATSSEPTVTPSSVG